jgi:hypothetical protein
MELQQVAPTGPPHTHDHDHHHHDHGDEQLEGLFTVGICGAFGVVAVAMSALPTLTDNPGNMLRHILVPKFHPYVFAGGVVLLFFTVIRAISLWKSAGHTHDCGHTHHDHGEACDHDHGHGHHDHGHGHHDHGHGHHDHDHSHGGIYWRAVVLLFPVVMFVIGQPNAGYSSKFLDSRLGKEVALGDVADVKLKEGGRKFTFDELNAFASIPDRRASEEGKQATVEGQIRRLGEKEATMYTQKMTCCVSDTVILKARIVITDNVITIPDNNWVEVTGILQFVQDPSNGEFIPLIKTTAKDVKKIAAKW